jgi:signal transduction histidine kinase
MPHMPITAEVWNMERVDHILIVDDDCGSRGLADRSIHLRIRHLRHCLPWPQSLASRLSLIVVGSLVLTHGLFLALLCYERSLNIALLPLLLTVQLVLLAVCTWLALRTAISPLARLSQAVARLDGNGQHMRLDEHGPAEVACTAAAFNTLQEQIAIYTKERMQLLAAISHDLQTPITRMKLRAEFMDAGVEKDKLNNDLNEMQHLVQEGVASARSMETSTEASRRVDLDAFIESLVFDYLDTGQEVQLCNKSAVVFDTRPHALRRVLVNLTDNAVKFAGAAEIQVQPHADRSLSIKVLDHGPGIPEAELPEVMKPFYRLENSRNRDTGGTGLGLTISQQLSLALGGSLKLYNREGGGLCAELRLPAALS